LLSLDSSQPARLVDFERARAEYSVAIGDGPIVFKRDGTGVIYPVREGQTDNLWLQHLDGSPGKQLTDFKAEFIRDFDYSYDGKQLADPRPQGIRRCPHSRLGEVIDSLIDVAGTADFGMTDMRKLAGAQCAFVPMVALPSYGSLLWSHVDSVHEPLPEVLPAEFAGSG